MKQQVKELIATRIKNQGDTWTLLSKGGSVYTSITDTLEAYFQMTKTRCDYHLSPMKGELYCVIEKDAEIVPPKKYNIYGEEM